MANFPLEKLAGTQTEKNLHSAIAGECQAYVKYQWYANKAKKDGYVEISNIFNITADNEKEHAEIWFKYLGGLGTTEQNLTAAAGGEHYEHTTMYADFAATAEKEGLTELARLFRQVGSIEKLHEDRYNEMKKQLVDGCTFTSDDSNTNWKCLNCGYEMMSKDAPQQCPVCSHPQAYFQKC